MKAKETLIKIQKEISTIKNRGEIQKIPLGAVSEKELKRELKTLKVLAKDPIAKAMISARSFTQWGGAIECCDGTAVSVLMVDHFGARTAYGIPSEVMDAPEILAELSDKPEQRTDWIHVADLINKSDRNQIVGRQELSVAQIVENGGLDEDAAYISAELLGTGVAAALQGKCEVAAVLIATLDEQAHTIMGSAMPKTRYFFEVPDEQAADWLRSLVKTLTSQPDALCLCEEGAETLVLGPHDGEAEEVHLPMKRTLPKLT